MGQGSLQSCRSGGPPHSPYGQVLPRSQAAEAISLILLETLQAWVLQRCCLKPDPFLQEVLKALTCSV